MTNATVIKMTKAGLSETIIISTINSHPGAYATNPDDLISLKNAGVSDKVIAAMIAKSTGASTAPVPQNKVAASSPKSRNTKGPIASGAPSGIVEAVLGNGDLKPARFAKIFVLPTQKAEAFKSTILTVAQKLDDARTAAVRQEGPNGPESSLVEMQCLAGLIKIRLSLVTVSISASTSPETSQDTVAFDADEEGKFQLQGIKADSFNVVAVGKVGMNAAIWMSDEETAGHTDSIKLDQPVFSCYDAQGV
ncbi:MAG TPA: hypothetical protein VFU68_04595, partial [Terracidiphilus sp.]|nr:hypothetical protein [Terracidiphilus sp.]